MITFFKLVLLSGPFPLISRGTPLYVPTQLSFVFRSAATISNTLFFGVHSVAGLPSKPAHVMTSPTCAPVDSTIDHKKNTKTFLKNRMSLLPSGGHINSTFSGVLAHITIASERTPLNLQGFKLTKHMTIRFCISARGICLTKPLQTFLNLPSPKSICSTYRPSASGCCSHFMIFPTLISNQATVASSGLNSSSRR